MLQRLQGILFEMAVTIKDIFEKNGVRYVIEYGSLLGAVRHGGFIPWDDDFDYVVFEDDYEKASEALRRELPTKYILHDRQSDPAYFYSFSKVRHLHSVAIEEGFTEKLMYNGVSIDLFKGREEKNNRYARRLFLAKSHTSSHWSKFKSDKRLSEFCKVLAYSLKTAFFSVLHSVTPKTPYFHKSPDTDQYFIPLDKYLPRTKVVFNGVEFYAPHDVDFVLTDRYGNWRAFPSSVSYHIDHLSLDSDQ